MPTAVVTGVLGFIGHHLAERLTSEGYRVSGIDSCRAGPDLDAKVWRLERLRRQGVEVELIDLSDAALEAHLPPGAIIFHCAGQGGVRESWDDLAPYLRNNVTASDRLVAAAIRTGARRLIVSSSSSVYGPHGAPRTPYGISKLAAEELCLVRARAAGLECIALRYFTVYGPGQRADMAFASFIRSIVAQRPLTVFGDGDQRRDFTYVDDVVEANLRAARVATLPENGHVDVGAGHPRTLRDAVAILGRELDRTPVLEHLPAVPGDPDSTCADVSALRDFLGWSPAIPLEVGLAAQVRDHLDRRDIHDGAATVMRGQNA